MLPTDIAYEKTTAKRLKEPLNVQPPEHDPEIEEFVLDEIVKLVEEADRDVIILVDACAVRHGVRHEVEELIKWTSFPVYSAPMGKTAVDEQHERYGGVSRVKSSLSWTSTLMGCQYILDLCWLDLASGHQGES